MILGVNHNDRRGSRFLTIKGVFNNRRVGRALAMGVLTAAFSVSLSLPATAEATSASALSGLRTSFFNSNEQRSQDTSAFTKWNTAVRKAGQATGGFTNVSLPSWTKPFNEFKSLSTMEKVRQVNAVVNRVPYISDNANWGRSDYWATPYEFFERGGDCEDYAIAKYTTLRSLGVPDSKMRLVVVDDLWKNMKHAVLVVDTAQGPMLLDNQTQDIKNAATYKRYRPIYSINASAWWYHTPKADTATQVASIQ